jgi:hypothetical protein
MPVGHIDHRAAAAAGHPPRVDTGELVRVELQELLNDDFVGVLRSLNLHAHVHTILIAARGYPTE